MVNIDQWVLVDLDVFRREYLHVKPLPQTNMDGTFFEAYRLSDFSPNLIVAASDNLRILLDPILDVPYVELDAIDKKRLIDFLIHGKPWASKSDYRINQSLDRDQALQRWHADPSIKVDFETYWQGLLRKGAA